MLQRLLDEGGPTGHITCEGEVERTLLTRGMEGPFIAIVAQSLTRFGTYDVNTVVVPWLALCVAIAAFGGLAEMRNRPRGWCVLQDAALQVAIHVALAGPRRTP